MIKILFICHGNICRSTMAQYVLQDMVNNQGIADRFYIDSAATSYEEIGNGVHPGTRNKLKVKAFHVVITEQDIWRRVIITNLTILLEWIVLILET